MLIDFQNIHLTARDRFGPPGALAARTLIHPVRFAEQVLATRAIRQQDLHQRTAGLVLVNVYRGLPSNGRQPGLYAAALAQRSERTRDPRVMVWYQPLRYPATWPAEPAREKGVDVKVAIDLIRLADSGAVDVIVVASHDTDLEPALELAGSHGRTKIETAGWVGAKRLRVPGRNIWHTALDEHGFARSRDFRPY